MILNTRHTGIVVRDLDRAIRFYEGLGLRLWRREMETGPFIEQGRAAKAKASLHS